MDVAPGPIVLEAMRVLQPVTPRVRTDAGQAAAQPRLWTAPSTIERGRLIDLVV